MTTPQPPCPHCGTSLFVRVEWVIAGATTHNLYYCGKCEHEWETRHQPAVRPKPDRRKAKRES
jgi:hypothetical protein